VYIAIVKGDIGLMDTNPHRYCGFFAHGRLHGYGAMKRLDGTVEGANYSVAHPLYDSTSVLINGRLAFIF
jgi:hypothetical protein